MRLRNLNPSVVILFIFFTQTLLAVEVQIIEKIPLSSKADQLQTPWDFCLIEDGLILITDYKAGNLKLFEKKGNGFLWAKTIAKKGYRVEELVKPVLCDYDKKTKRLAVMSIGQRMIFFYNQIGAVDFEQEKTDIACWYGAYDIKFKEHRLFVSGYTKRNEQDYDFYAVDLGNQYTINYLLPSHWKYHMSPVEYNDKYNEVVLPIGIQGWFDIQGDYAYFVWEGDLRVIKIDLATNRVIPKPFGIYPKDYVKPYSTPQMVKWRKLNPEHPLLKNEKEKMTFTKGIFTSADHVLVIYQNPTKNNSQPSYRMQFYTFDGTFKGEVPIPSDPGQKMKFDKDNNILYSLGGNASDGYWIKTYKVIE